MKHLPQCLAYSRCSIKEANIIDFRVEDEMRWMGEFYNF